MTTVTLSNEALVINYFITRNSSNDILRDAYSHQNTIEAMSKIMEATRPGYDENKATLGNGDETVADMRTKAEKVINEKLSSPFLKTLIEIADSLAPFYNSLKEMDPELVASIFESHKIDNYEGFDEEVKQKPLPKFVILNANDIDPTKIAEMLGGTNIEKINFGSQEEDENGEE